MEKHNAGWLYRAVCLVNDEMLCNLNLEYRINGNYYGRYGNEKSTD